MNGVLVDTNIILDIATENPNWFIWSAEKLNYYADRYPLFINKIIYAEVSIGYQRVEELELAIPSALFKRAIIPWEAAFLAGKAYLKYCRNGGKKTQPLPDFFIAAHAMIDNFLLLTRDSKGYKHYFPDLQLITPEP
jgi:predicted nucleic acid-binding protein